MLEGDNGCRGIALFLPDRRMSGRGYDHRLLFERKGLFERRVGNRLGHECGVEFAGQDRGCELLRIAGAQFQRHFGIADDDMRSAAFGKRTAAVLSIAPRRNRPRGLRIVERGAGLVGQRRAAGRHSRAAHCPAGARCSRLPSRMNSATSRSSSSWRMRVVTLDCTRFSFSAARVTPPSRTTAREDAEIGQVHFAHLIWRSIISLLFIL